MAAQNNFDPTDHEYIMDKRLKAAVDVALDLGMPLLVARRRSISFSEWMLYRSSGECLS